MLLEAYIVFIVFALAFCFVMRKLRSTGNEKSIESITDQLSIIIPFRNEKGNLVNLFSSLEEQTVFPAKLIFVNDHSDDGEAQLVRKWCDSHSFAELIVLAEGEEGKKRAIHKAIERTDTKFIMTIDADVWFDRDFFETIELPVENKMLVRPVVLKGNGFLPHLFALEHLFFNSFNFLVFPIYELSASGANLIYRKSDYIELNKIEEHQHIASGDDHFLLRSFQREGLKVQINNNRSQVLYSKTPSNCKEYLYQRIRWLGKTYHKTTSIEILLGLFISIYLLGGFVLLVYLLIQTLFTAAILLFAVRFILDILVLSFYAVPLKEGRQILLLPLMQLIYPFMMISVVLGALFVKPKWKGRRT